MLCTQVDPCQPTVCQYKTEALLASCQAVTLTRRGIQLSLVPSLPKHRVELPFHQINQLLTLQFAIVDFSRQTQYLLAMEREGMGGKEEIRELHEKK